MVLIQWSRVLTLSFIRQQEQKTWHISLAWCTKLHVICDGTSSILRKTTVLLNILMNHQWRSFTGTALWNIKLQHVTNKKNLTAPEMVGYKNTFSDCDFWFSNSLWGRSNVENARDAKAKTVEHANIAWTRRNMADLGNLSSVVFLAGAQVWWVYTSTRIPCTLLQGSCSKISLS